MSHWRTLMDPKEYLYAFDLGGKDVTLEIESVSAGELIGENGRKSKKPVASFKGTTKKLALNITNCKALKALFGSDETNDWRGQRITLFATTTTYGGAQVDCVRIRPTLPPPAAKSTKTEAA